MFNANRKIQHVIFTAFTTVMEKKRKKKKSGFENDTHKFSCYQEN